MTDKPLEHGTGLLLPLYEDPRRIPLSAVETPLTSENLPNAHFADISTLLVNDQMRTGSCVGQATSKMKEYQEKQEDSVTYTFSPRYVYALCKKYDGYDGWGTYLVTGLKIAKNWGSVRRNIYFVEDTHLPDEQFRDWNIIPTEAYTEGKNFTTEGYAYVYRQDLDALKSALVKHGVLVGGFSLTNEGFRTSAGDPRVREPGVGETIYGHAVMFYGYETLPDGKTALWFRNSWGQGWGNRGNGYLVFEDYAPLFDMWLSIDLPSELIGKAQSMLALIKGDKRGEIFVHHADKKYWVKPAEMLTRFMGKLWGEPGWALDQLYAQYIQVVPQVDVDAIEDGGVFIATTE